jgi:hypothetical protein
MKGIYDKAFLVFNKQYFQNDNALKYESIDE